MFSRASRRSSAPATLTCLFAATATVGLGLAAHAPAQTYTWDDETGDNFWFTVDNWDLNSDFPNAPGESVVIGAPSPTILNNNVNIDSLTVTADGELIINPSLNLDIVTTGFLTNAGTITANNFSDLVFVNTVDNSGLITIADTTAASTTDIELRSDVDLIGGGTIVLSGADAGINDVSGTQTLSIVDQLIRGEGNLGQGTITVINQAGNVIDADVNGGTLTMDGVASSGNPAITNAGTLQASNGGTLALPGFGADVLDNTGGTIQALAGSIVLFNSGGSVENGVIQSVGTGEVRIADNEEASFFDVTFNGDNIVAGNNTDFGVGGTITNTGTITIADTLAAGQSDLEVQVGGATLTGGGTIVLSGVQAGVNDSTATQTLTIADQTIRGEGNLGRGTITIIHQAGNVIDADVNGGTLTMDGVASSGNPAITNAGTLQASNGGTLALPGFGADVLDNTGGTIQALAGSIVLFNSGGSVENGVIQSVGTGEVRIADNEEASFFDVTFNGDNIVAGNNTDFGVGGTITNTGTITIADTLAAGQSDLEVQVGGATLTGGGTIVLSGTQAGVNDITGTQTLTIADQTIRGEGNLGQGTIVIDNQAGGLIHADVNASTLAINGFGNITNAGELRATNGATLSTAKGFTNDGTITAGTASLVDIGGDLVSNGLLQGNGRIEAASLTNNGTIAPGQSAGNLEIQPDTTLSGTSLIDIEIGGTVQVSEYDLAGFVQELVLGGELSVSLIDGFIPTATDTFTVITADAITGGQFSNVAPGGTLLTDSGLYFFAVQYGSSSPFNANSVVLTDFRVVPEPTTLALLGLASASLLLRRRA